MASPFGILISVRKWLVLSLVLSLTVHLVAFGGYLLLGERVREVVHRITFESPPPPSLFVKHPRGTARVLEFRKQPVPRGFYLRQRGTGVRARVAEVQAVAAMRTEAILRQLNPGAMTPPSLRPGPRLGVGGDGARDVEMTGGVGLALPALSGVEVRGLKETRQQVDMNLDMLSIEDMDTGEYRAMVIQDPVDRKNIKGYIHLAYVNTRELLFVDRELLTYRSNFEYLIKALDAYTGIRADHIGGIALDDPTLLKVPWFIFPFEIGRGYVRSRQASGVDQVKAAPAYILLSEGELENLGRYLAEGGFVVAESGKHVFEDALRTQGLNEGAHWCWVYLKSDHPIYHAFFDFDMSVHQNAFSDRGGFRTGDQGLEIGGRLAVFMPGGGIITDRAIAGSGGSHYIKHDGTRSLQFALNTLVFALTQEGSMTQQLMAGIR